MRHSDFWRLMTEEFGSAYAATLARDQFIAALGDRTAQQALDAGIPPREVWAAVCDQMHVPAERRLGRDAKPHGRS